MEQRQRGAWPRIKRSLFLLIGGAKGVAVVIRQVAFWSALVGVPASLRWWTDYDVPWPVAIAWIGTVIVAFCLALWAVYSQQNKVDKVLDEGRRHRNEQRRHVASAIRDVLMSRSAAFTLALEQSNAAASDPTAVQRVSEELIDYLSRVRKLRNEANRLTSQEAAIVQGVCVPLELDIHPADLTRTLTSDTRPINRLATVYKELVGLTEPELEDDEVQSIVNMLTVTPTEDR